MLADSGFDGKAVQGYGLIPLHRCAGKIVDLNRKAMADLVSQARLEGVFGQCWMTEMDNSVIKPKFGGHIRSSLPVHQNREPILKGLIYNIHPYWFLSPASIIAQEQIQVSKQIEDCYHFFMI